MDDDPPSPTFEPTVGVTSPILANLGQRPFVRPAQDADEWDQADAFGISPPYNPIHTPEPVASSPPAPSSPRQAPEEMRATFNNQSPRMSPRPVYRRPAPASPRQLPVETRGPFTNQSPPTSPRPAYRQPARQVRQETPSVAGYLATSPRGRPVSMPHQPPPSHIMPQFASPPTHFHRDAARRTYQSRSSSRRAPVNEFQAFDTLPTLIEDSSSSGVPVLLSSCQNSLYIHEVATDSLRYLGHVDGLRGAIVSAKIIPVSQRNDRIHGMRPLVVAIVHGPYIPAGEGQNEVMMDRSLHSEYAPSQVASQAPTTIRVDGIENKYQTTVEVYSLRERRHVSTLYRSPVVDIDIVPGQVFAEAPPPVGSLSIEAKGRFITVTSAVSGEVYMYEAAKSEGGVPFTCIGKIWTSIPTRKHRAWSVSSGTPSTELDGNIEASAQSPAIDIPMLSLSPRWLAVVPPVPSLKSTLHGTVDRSLQDKSTPGLTSHTSGSHPAVTCELDAPLEESRINRAARDVTQEFLKGAQWVGSQGMQAWKNYWNKPDESAESQEPPRSPPINPQFPPTHASDDNTRARQHPVIVTIVDLEKLSETQEVKSETALRPAATFSLADGCSFLSFNPNGLMLLTASVKGDVQYVWDLMRMMNPRSDTFAATTSVSGPQVRQVARFTRMTQASIVDVIWCEPAGEKLAVLTERGTVHVHDLPSNVFSWPPPRTKRPAHPQKRQSDIVPAAASGGWGATLSSMTGRAQPIIAAARETRMPNLSGINIGAAGTGAGVKGGKLVASGFSKSMGAATGTVNSLYHMGENRLHIPPSSNRHIKPGVACWIQQKEFVGIAVVGESKIQIHAVIRNSDIRGGRKRHSIVGHRLAEHNAPKKREPDPELPGDGYLLGGFWPMMPQRPRSSRATPTPFSQAELETCAPFQPFHMDGRVQLRVFQNDGFHMDHEPQPWMFGQPIPTREVPTTSADDDRHLEAAGAMDSFMHETGIAGEHSAPRAVISSKRRKGKKADLGTATARDLIEGSRAESNIYDAEEPAQQAAVQDWLIDDS